MGRWCASEWCDAGQLFVVEGRSPRWLAVLMRFPETLLAGHSPRSTACSPGCFNTRSGKRDEPRWHTPAWAAARER